MKLKLIAASILLLLILNACYYDKAAILYPDIIPSTCDTLTKAAFLADVWPILENKCNSCHSGTYASGGIDLTTYDKIKVYVTNGKLMGSINWASGYSAMPKNQSKLPACDIKKVQLWIDAGAPNN